MSSRDGPRDPALIWLRPIATPLSLGLLAQAVMSFVLSGYELAWVDQTAQAHAVALIALVVVVPLQAGASVFGFLARDPAAATGLGILAGTWAAFGAVKLLSAPGARSATLGLLLCAAGVALVVPAAASFTGKIAAGLVLLIAAARFAVSGAYELGGSATVQHAAGIVGLVLSAVALYAALAFELEGVTGRTVLPIGRHGHGALAMQGDLGEQMRQLPHEPGVRRPL